MVKSPKIRHSKSSTEPVTIDLGADEVSRIPPESAGGRAAEKTAEPKKTAAETTGKAATEGKTGEPDRSPTAAGTSPAAKHTAGSVPPVAPSPTSAARTSDSPKLETAAKPDTSTKPDTESKSQAGSKTDATGLKGPAGGPTGFGRDGGGRPPSPPPPQPQARAETPRRGAGSLIAAGMVGGLVVLGGAAGAWYGGLLPTAGTPAAPDSQATDALRAEIETLKGELAELRSQPAATGGEPAGLSDANARIESVSVLVEEVRAQLAQLTERTEAGGSGGDAAALEDFRTSLAALQERVAALPGESSGADAEALRAEIARVEESVRSATDTASSASEAANATGARIDALEQSLGALSARVEEQDQMPSVALAIAASTLKAAIDRGTPFVSELETFAGLAPDAPEVAELRTMAASGVPTRAQIAAETDAAAVRMIEAGRVIDPQAGVLDRLWASAQSLVTVRPIGQVEGDDVPAIVARMEAALTAGDYERAIAEYDTLPQDAKAAGGDFIEKVRARHAADRLAEQTLSAALRA